MSHILVYRSPRRPGIITDPWALIDGRLGASAGTPQFPTLLNTYGIKRPPWQVVGVDYPAGPPAGISYKHPSTEPLQSGVTRSVGTHTYTVTGNNVTLDGYDFSEDGGWGVVVTGNDCRITNNNFNSGANSKEPIRTGTGATNLTIDHNIIDGNADPDVSGNIQFLGTGVLTMKHNWIKNAGSDLIQLHTGGSPATVIALHNIIENGGMAPGAHGDWTEYIDGPFTVTTNFNLGYQHGGTSQGLMCEPDGAGFSGVIVSGEYGYNTLLGTANILTGITVADIVNTFTVHDNYYDESAASGGFTVGGGRGEPNDGNAKSIYSNNRNMVTGALGGNDSPPGTP